MTQTVYAHMNKRFFFQLKKTKKIACQDKGGSSMVEPMVSMHTAKQKNKQQQKN
jgi:hypothetical protein